MGAVGLKQSFAGTSPSARTGKSWAPVRFGAGNKSKPVHILIACMPKSGSTFLSDVISQCPGFRRAVLTPSAGRREQEIDEQLLRKLGHTSFVAQHHVRNSEWTSEMCRTYGVAPVVLIRSLQDVVVSLRDHMRRESAVFPQFFAEAQHASLDDAKLEQMIARLALPWYLNFYMSWRNTPGAMVVTYEELTASPADVIHGVLAFSGAAASRDDVKLAVEKARMRESSRLNVGIAGRGSALRPETVKTILDLVGLYPEAANDPYIRSVKAQAQAALSGAVAPFVYLPRPMRRPPAPARRWLSRREKKLLVHWVAPALLVTIALTYWAWPLDLIPDHSAFGYADDAAVMLVTSFLAGVFRYKKV